MSDVGNLICWNCLQRTPPGKCIHCSVELTRPEEAFEEKKEDRQIKRIIELPSQLPNGETIRFSLEQLVELVEGCFTIKRNIMITTPEFIVEHPGNDLDFKFTQLVDDSNNLVNGLYPVIEKYKGGEDLLIRYIYNIPPRPQEFRTIFLLGLFTIFSVFSAGLYNASKLYQAAHGDLPQGLSILNLFVLNADTVVSSIFFTVVLVILIALKDSVQLKGIFSNFSNNITPFYIPAPPIFELGTFGSINKQDKIHVTRQEMYHTTFLGPLLAWFASVIILFITLPLAVKNPSAAVEYGKHSIVANGVFEPIIFTVLVNLSNLLGLTVIDTSAPFTTLYLLHPVSLAALGGFYIASFSLIPAAHFNGGYIIRASFGKKAHRYATYLSIAIVYYIHWTLSVFLFFIHEILKTPQLLNEESKIGKKDKYLLVVFFIILLVSFPFRLRDISFIYP